MTSSSLPPSDRPPDPAANGGELPVAAGWRQRAGWLMGPAFLLVTLLLPPPDGLSPEGWRTAGVAGLMAVWWICECIPIPVTALLPIVLFPLLRLGDIRETTAPFAHPVIYLFLGGFLIALAMQRWNLHRRIALHLISLVGTNPRRLVGGFLLSSALLSMWVSNTATTLMMLPIAVSVIQLLPATAPRFSAPFSAALVLAVAYGATTGGMGTLIGTPPNALLAAYVSSTYGLTIGFGQWMLIGVPVVLLTLPAVYWLLTRMSFKLDDRQIPGVVGLLHTEKRGLGPITRAEWTVALVFLLTALGWIFQPLLARALPLLSDTTIALLGALLLFILPAGGGRPGRIMTWAGTKELPWEVFLLFGGGLSLAAGIERHGLSLYLGGLCGTFQGLPVLLVLGIVGFCILMLTELTSNTATAATFLPIAAAVAFTYGEHPLVFLVPVALAANCSYMLPVGTPPNAIVFASGCVTLPQMARAGFLMNLFLTPVIVLLAYYLVPLLFDLSAP